MTLSDYRALKAGLEGIADLSNQIRLNEQERREIERQIEILESDTSTLKSDINSIELELRKGQDDELKKLKLNFEEQFPGITADETNAKRILEKLELEQEELEPKYQGSHLELYAQFILAIALFAKAIPVYDQDLVLEGSSFFEGVVWITAILYVPFGLLLILWRGFEIWLFGFSSLEGEEVPAFFSITQALNNKRKSEFWELYFDYSRRGEVANDFIEHLQHLSNLESDLEERRARLNSVDQDLVLHNANLPIRVERMEELYRQIDEANQSIAHLIP